MLSTIVLAAVLFGLLITAALLWGLFLRWGLRWAKVPDVTFRRVAAATAMVLILHVVLESILLLVSSSLAVQETLLAVVGLTAGVLIPCAVISLVFKTQLLRAFQAWLVTLLSSLPSFAVLLFVVRPFVFETFVVPTNAMAPTLLGTHWQGVCSQCGSPNYCSPYRFSGPTPNMICDNFHVTQPDEVEERVHAGDRFFVAKYLRPRRWDVIVFKYPEQPDILYVKRLVGFPDEKVIIQDGEVWINGERQVPPESLQGIEYLSELPESVDLEIWGSANRPAVLGDDEYFVLGDFSLQSKDSRLWEQGAPGHPAFAVPESHLVGVLTHTYWPPHRWRIHR